MQAKEFGEVLRSFASLIDAAGTTGRAAELLTFAEAMSEADTLPVSKTVSAVQKRWKSTKRTPRHPAGLAALLTRISAILRTAGAKAGGDCAAVLKLFAGEPTEEAAPFAAEVKAAILAPPPVNRPKTADQKLDAAAIEKLADRLICHRVNNAEFDVAFAEVEAAKLKKSELAAIAHRFLGSERSFKTTAEIMKAIKNRQLQDALQASRDRRIEKIAV